jgi:hypothetical protein
MSSKGKYIGIESRIQYGILESAIFDYLCNNYLNKEKCLQHIKQYTKGDNRAGKILKHITVLLSKNNILLSVLSKSIKCDSFYLLSAQERKALILALFSNSFPITYDILNGFAQVFKVQKIVSKEVIVQKIGAIYGGNRSMHIAITELLPFLIECNLIQRPKVGFYTLGNKLVINNKFISELIIFTDIKQSGSKSILIDDLNFKPWFIYFDISALSPENYSLLLSKKDSAVGKGYLTI